jgi:hypothetical protein
MISNEQVVDQITGILNREFVCYGYLKVAKELVQQGYHINLKRCTG